MLTAQRQQLASSSCLRHNRHQLQQHTRQHRRRSTVVVASAYTQPACAAIRNAQQEACRQASMFLAPPHLLQGLLDTAESSACQLLLDAGMTAAAAEAAFVDPQMLPTAGSSGTFAGDLHWAPDARKALQIASLLSDAAGKEAAGTPHLLLGLLDCGNAAVKKALSKAGVELLELRVKAEQAAGSCEEAVAPRQQPVAPEQQAAQLVQQYQAWVAQHGDTPPPSGALRVPGQQPPARTAADDDIYE